MDKKPIDQIIFECIFYLVGGLGILWLLVYIGEHSG